MQGDDFESEHGESRQGRNEGDKRDAYRNAQEDADADPDGNRDPGEGLQ